MMSSAHSQLTMHFLIEGPFSLTFLLTGWTLTPPPSWPWLTPVITSTLAWTPTTPATPSPTVASASRSTGTEKSTTCTWGRRVGDYCSVIYPLYDHSLSHPTPPPDFLGGFSFLQASTLWSTSCPAWDRTTPPPPGMSFRNRLNKLGKRTETSSFKANFFP